MDDFWPLRFIQRWLFLWVSSPIVDDLWWGIPYIGTQWTKIIQISMFFVITIWMFIQRMCIFFGHHILDNPILWCYMHAVVYLVSIPYHHPINHFQSQHGLGTATGAGTGTGSRRKAIATSIYTSSLALQKWSTDFESTDWSRDLPAQTFLNLFLPLTFELTGMGCSCVADLTPNSDSSHWLVSLITWLACCQATKATSMEV